MKTNLILEILKSFKKTLIHGISEDVVFGTIHVNFIIHLDLHKCRIQLCSQTQVKLIQTIRTNKIYALVKTLENYNFVDCEL